MQTCEGCGQTLHEAARFPGVIWAGVRGWSECDEHPSGTHEPADAERGPVARAFAWREAHGRTTLQERADVADALTARKGE